MNFTFGIITNGENNNFVEKIIESIRYQNIPNYEIIIVGGKNLYNDFYIKHIEFDENVKQKWITKKKNLITVESKYENIVYLHDYISLCEDWYEGFLKYGDNFKICMTKMLNIDGTRYRDWHIGWCHLVRNKEYLIPYDMTHLSRYMYISGAYWIGKKDIMLKYPLDESRSWGQAEDAEWSDRYKRNNEFSINKYSTVKLLKYNDVVFKIATEETIKYLNLIK